MFWVESDFRGRSRCVAGEGLRAADRQLAAGTPTEAAYTLRSWLHGFVLQLYLLSVGVYLLLAHALNPGRNPLPRQKLCFTSVPACCPHACYSPAVLRCMEHLAVPSQRLHLRRLRKSAASYGQLSSGVNTATCRRSCICSVSQPQAGCRLHRLAAFAPPPHHVGSAPACACCWHQAHVSGGLRAGCREALHPS